MTGLLLCCALAAQGCFSDPPDAHARMAALESEGKALNASADLLEERLMASQAELQLWAELQARHRDVSALACTNQTEHFDAMVRSIAFQQEKSRRLHRGAEAAFSVEQPVSMGEPGGSLGGHGRMMSP